MTYLYSPDEENFNQNFQPSNGEKFILEKLRSTLPQDYEIYLKPVFNGEVIDIVILRKGCGVALITVRDWKLQEVSLDAEGQWFDTKKSLPLIAPDRQVDGCKWNMFDLHISGLAEKAALNENFWKVIHSFVFFHQSKKDDINALFSLRENALHRKRALINEKYKGNEVCYEQYHNSILELDNTAKRMAFNKGTLITDDALHQIEKKLSRHVLFVDGIYKAFIEYLRPKYHEKSEGVATKFVGKRARLIQSKPGFQKIKGVAGSGKTTMLATRAVDSQLRHGGRVLVLTFNKTLRNHIKSRINTVPRDFDSGSIVISNYHSFINMNLTVCGMSASPSDQKKLASMEKHFQEFYVNENMFSGYEELLLQYESIFIDEIQDYEPAWIKIIRKFFLKENSEMVLYGDEGQNIYGRDLKGPKSVIVQGFGTWERLTRSMRSEPSSPLTEVVKNFQEEYLLSKYDIDAIDTGPKSASLKLDPPKANLYSSRLPKVSQIIDAVLDLKKREVSEGDIVVLCSSVEILQKFEASILEQHGIGAMTTFESQEQLVELKKKYGEPEIPRKVKKIRESKKFSFEQTSPLLKISTVHSFKGMESSAVVLIVLPEDREEIVYTGITRAKQYLDIWISDSSQFCNFFASQPGLEFESQITGSSRLQGKP